MENIVGHKHWTIEMGRILKQLNSDAYFWIWTNIYSHPSLNAIKCYGIKL